MEIWGVGHSLGAHLMGQAGRKSKVFTRITGLDPAGPSFENGVNKDERLQKKSDAQSIVDVRYIPMVMTQFGVFANVMITMKL